MQPLIELKDVDLQYKIKGNIFTKNKHYNVLKNINLKIYPGETIGIIGKNGSGKSSLLKILSGVIQPTSGKIINHGVSTSLLTIGAGFDNNLSGRDNSILSGMLQGLKSHEIKSKLNEIHDYSKLGDFFFQPVRTYSTGMRARLGFSISNTLNPDIWLIDEILGVGDHEFRQKSQKCITEKTRSNKAVVLVSHAINKLSQISHRMIYIDKEGGVILGDKKTIIKMYEKID